MGKARRKDNSVVFIGEDEDKETRTPLLKQEDAWSSNSVTEKLKTNVNEGLLSSKNQYQFQKSFLQYLLSENSVIFRILSSLLPPIGRFKRIAVDFEGSFLSTFLLTATVYWGLVNSRGDDRLLSLVHSVGLTVGYIVVVSTLTWGLAKCTKTTITFRQIVSVLGYGLFGHAAVLLICEAGSDEWFMTLMTILGGLDSVRICLILLSRTPIPACRFVLCTPVSIVHLMYLIDMNISVMVFVPCMLDAKSKRKYFPFGN